MMTLQKLTAPFLTLVTLAASTPAQAQHGLPQIIRDAAEMRMSGCFVKLWVDGWANQLYLHGKFSGNYKESQNEELARQLDYHLSTGRCSYTDGQGVPGRLPREILDASAGRYRLLNVKLWVDGWANQLYLNGVFSGNFTESESGKLVEIIRQHDIQRFPRLVRAAEAGRIEGCNVKFLIQGWANQLFVRGIFSGNFRVGELNKLNDALRYHLSTGRCTLLDSRDGDYDDGRSDGRNDGRVEPCRGCGSEPIKN